MFALSCSNGPPFTEVLFGRDCSGRLTLLCPETGHVLTLGREGGRGRAERGSTGAGCVPSGESLNLSGLLTAHRSNVGAGHRIHASPVIRSSKSR